VSHDRDFLQGMSNIVYEFKDQKIKEYLGDINFSRTAQPPEHARSREKRPRQKRYLKKTSRFRTKTKKKNKTLLNRLSKVESQIKQLEIDIRNDDKALASNYDKHIEDANFFGLQQEKGS
jgi:ATP-binding cassette subfamily F protein 3